MLTGQTASSMRISPAIKLISVFAVAIALQSVLGLPLALALCLWALTRHRVRFFKLIRRVRLLIVVLFMVTLLMTPGAALWPEWGLYPTEEGMLLGMTQLLRLVGMLAAVTLLLDTTDDRSLAAGSLALLQPLAGKRQWPERAVARLLLVFHYLETAPKPRNLDDVLALAGADLSVATAVDAPDVLELEVVPLSARDLILAGLMLGAAFLSLAWGGVA
jgi:energy-coupling factor transporter transmembrane protein EcfT